MSDDSALVLLHEISAIAGGTEVQGILLIFPTKELSERPFEVLEDYFAQGGRHGFISVSFDKGGDESFTFSWIIESMNATFICEAKNVSIGIVEDIVASLKVLKYGFLVSGFSDPDVGWRILHGCNYSFSRLGLNGATLTARGNQLVSPKDLEVLSKLTGSGRIH